MPLTFMPRPVMAVALSVPVLLELEPVSSTLRVSVPAPVMERVAWMPLMLPVRVGALEPTMMVVPPEVTIVVAAVRLWILKWSAPPPLVRVVALASAVRLKVSAPDPPLTVVVVEELVLVMLNVSPPVPRPMVMLARPV